ncbi:hypothetical protein C475_18388 [Halosimplex carlsbadense 2-9-1]|uniref:DUF5658 domain-containing protein n=1 Tax=Halosimplex carlsbadense 2-9-1 TaxID=797114 RepID=M0CIT2_9EURY|nr:DUF5658 family protein [Halosimplex carlsbadense]ELZ22508.1 hypothetical protein C475_18388 [Halosimplex carlsbadense 2-9-1]
MPLVTTDPTAIDSSALDEYLGTVPGSVSDLELLLWVLVCWALVLDIVLTAYGLSIGLVERNPLMRQALETFGLAALGLAKAGAVAVALVFRFLWPEYAIVAPLGLAIPWILAVLINATLLASL